MIYLYPKQEIKRKRLFMKHICKYTKQSVLRFLVQILRSYSSVRGEYQIELLNVVPISQRAPGITNYFVI